MNHLFRWSNVQRVNKHNTAPNYMRGAFQASQASLAALLSVAALPLAVGCSSEQDFGDESTLDEGSFEDSSSDDKAQTNSAGTEVAIDPRKAFNALACEVLEKYVNPEKKFANTLITKGISVPFNVSGARQEMGFELVYDTTRREAAVFSFRNGGVVGSMAGLSVGAYEGIAFASDPTKTVIETWSGEFDAVGAGVSAGPLSAGIQVFTTPDGSLLGAASSIGIGKSVSPPVEVTVQAGQWNPVNEATNFLGNYGRKYGKGQPTREFRTTKGKRYIYFDDPLDMQRHALSLGLSTPSLQSSMIASTTLGAAAQAAYRGFCS